MELTKKTTILLSEEGHRQLAAVAAQRGVSMGALIREACAQVYGIVDEEVRMSAASALAAFSLPVGTPAAMKRESVPTIGTAKS
ncbi:MAG: CopG family transcriptional regulator [Gemmatimonadaceae bacterium]